MVLSFVHSLNGLGHEDSSAAPV